MALDCSPELCLQFLINVYMGNCDFCISQYLSGINFVYWIVATYFSRSLFYIENGLGFKFVLRKILVTVYLSARKQT